LAKDLRGILKRIQSLSEKHPALKYAFLVAFVPFGTETAVIVFLGKSARKIREKRKKKAKKRQEERQAE
jgi:hypothetical protein